MKILMISSGYAPFSNGGVEVMTQVLAEALVKENYKVTVIIFGDEEKEYYVNGVKIRICRSIEIHLKSKMITNRINRLLQMYNPFNKRVFNRILDEEMPDIVHVEMLRRASYSAFRTLKDRGIKTVITLHEIFSLWNFDPFDQFKNMLISKPDLICRMIRAKHRKVTRNIGIVTAPCQWIVDAYTEDGYYLDCDYQVILNAMPFDKDKNDVILHEKEKRIKKDHVVRFLYIGRMDVFKGIELILETMKINQDQNIEVHFAGEGPLKKDVQRAAEQDDRIVVHGYVDGEEKENLFCHSDVLLFLSEDIETFGLVCMEAMNYSLPIITSKIRSTHFFVRNNYNGIVLEKRDKTLLKEAMERYHDKEILISHARADQEMRKKYDFSRYVNENVELYQKLMNEYYVQNNRNRALNKETEEY